MTPAGKCGNLSKVIEKTKQSVHSHRSTKGDYRLIKFRNREICFRENDYKVDSYAVHLFLVYEGAKVVHALMEVQNY